MTSGSNQVAERRLARLSFALLAIALLLGGSGAVAPLHNMAIQAVSLVLLGLMGWRASAPLRTTAERAGAILLLLILALPLAQLLPLPFAVWSHLPGRELAIQVTALVDGSARWRPLSLNPEATWLAALYLLAPAAIFLAALRLDGRAQRRLVAIVVGCALASMLLALLQAASGGRFHLYDSAHNRFATGLFINRNHQASFLLATMPLASALLMRWRSLAPSMRVMLTLTMIIAFSAGIIATMSRMGFVLLPIAIAGALSYLPITRLLRERRAMLAGLAALSFGAVLVGLSAGTQRTLERFAGLTDSRFDYWPDVILAIRQYFPWGSGIGTFDTVYRTVENLNLVEPTYINHAHNEYLQIALEAGLPGLLLLAVFLMLLTWLALRPLATGAAPYRRAASVAILVLLLHSTVDYPLRTMALITLFGLLCALLYPGPANAASAAPRRDGPLNLKEKLL